jgi:ubiquinone/menaquinone biosynthesis C-methylase UbiE
VSEPSVFSGVDSRPDVSKRLVSYLLGVEQRPDMIAMHSAANALVEVRPGDHVLDAGCGTGGAALELTQAVGPNGIVVGVDASETMLAVARSRAAGTVRFEQGDLSALAFPDDEFDLVRCERVLQHVPDADAAVRELVRVCRPGGQVLLLDTDWRTLSVDLDNQALVDAALGLLPGHGRYPRSGFELRRRLVRSGCVDVQAVPHVFHMTTVEDAAGLLAMFDRDLPLGTPILSDRVRGAWFSALEKGERDGTLLAAVTAWAAAGRKAG